MQHLNTEKLHSAFSGPVFPLEDEGAYRISLKNQRSEQKKQMNLPVNRNLPSYPPQTEAHQANTPFSKMLNDITDPSGLAAETNNSLFITIKSKSGSLSPPPPALSPASLSSVNSSNFNCSSRASPAPPVIADEDGQPSNFQLGIHRLPSHPSNTPPKLTSSLDSRSNACSFKLFEKRTCLPALSTVGSSDSATSSSSSTSSVLDERDSRLHTAQTNGIPILEKISVSLSVSKCDKVTNLSPLLLHNFVNFSESQKHENGLISPKVEVNRLSVPTGVPDNVESAPVTDLPANVENLAKSGENCFSNFTKVDSDDLPTAKKRKQQPRRKRTVKKPWAKDSDSDFDDSTRPGPRRTSGKCSLVKRIKEKAKRKSNAGSTNNAQRNLNELASRRRYLESPFFCLCQSSTEPVDDPSKEIANNEFSFNVPAHIINPALRDCSSADFRLAPSCPILQQNSIANKFPIGRTSVINNDASTSEIQSYFHNSSYRPTLRPISRDTRIPVTYCETDCVSWCCVFCSEPSDFLSLGPLYGPYFSSEAVTTKQSPSTAECSDSVCTTGLPTQNVIKKPALSGVVSSAVTRSAASQARPSIAKAGSLRLVIKSITPPKHSASSKRSSVRKSQPLEQSSSRRRIGRDGEVWLHLECALWAPGTFLYGDGRIGGLDDAINMALNAMCSHCHKEGAILSCLSRGCGLCYHYFCAKLCDCHFNTEQLTILCKKHFVYC